MPLHRSLLLSSGLNVNVLHKCERPPTEVGHGAHLLLCTDFHFFVSLRSELQDTVADLRAQLQRQAGQLDSATALEGVLSEQQREMNQLHSQLLEQQQANDGLQREATLAHIQLEESREAFRVRIQHCMLEVCLQWVIESFYAQHVHACLITTIRHTPCMIQHHACGAGTGVVGVLWYGLVRSGLVW